MRFSDKISNLKFHRNFTILGSKLIVLSAGTSAPPYTPAGPPRSCRPTVFAGDPWAGSRRRHLPTSPAAKGTSKISSLLLIIRRAYRRTRSSARRPGSFRAGRKFEVPGRRKASGRGLLKRKVDPEPRYPRFNRRDAPRALCPLPSSASDRGDLCICCWQIERSLRDPCLVSVNGTQRGRVFPDGFMAGPELPLMVPGACECSPRLAVVFGTGLCDLHISSGV